jgi:hypothetical protein
MNLVIISKIQVKLCIATTISSEIFSSLNLIDRRVMQFVSQGKQMNKTYACSIQFYSLCHIVI